MQSTIRNHTYVYIYIYIIYIYIYIHWLYDDMVDSSLFGWLQTGDSKSNPPIDLSFPAIPGSAEDAGTEFKEPEHLPKSGSQGFLVGGDWNMTFILPYIGNNHPNWLIFFRGVGIPPTRFPRIGGKMPGCGCGERTWSVCNTFLFGPFCVLPVKGGIIPVKLMTRYDSVMENMCWMVLTSS